MHTDSASFFYEMVLERLGGGVALCKKMQCYKLRTGEAVKILYSKIRGGRRQYWYSISASSLREIKKLKCDIFVFILGKDGFVKIPLAMLEECLSEAQATRNPDGSIKHYHVYISKPPNVVLKGDGYSIERNVWLHYQSFNKQTSQASTHTQKQ